MKLPQRSHWRSAFFACAALLLACALALPQAATRQAPARAPAPVMSSDAADWLVRPERAEEEHPDELIRALRIQPRSTVADVGAGAGYYTWRLARAVGPEGRVYAEDIQPGMIRRLHATIAHYGVENVTEVLGTETDPMLPPHRFDLILLVDVYHEFSHPQQMLAHLRQALAPRGRLVLVEFRGEDPSVPVQSLHKMTVQQVLSELQPAGFQLVQRLEMLPRQHVLIFSATTPTVH